MSKPYLVVMGTDFSTHATRALGVAFEQARLHEPAELHVIHASPLAASQGVVPIAALGFPSVPGPSLEAQREVLIAYLDRELSALPGSDHAKVRVIGHVITDAPSPAIVNLASQLQAHLLVVGSHGAHGVARWLLGSVAERVVRQATCPVLVVPPPTEQLEIPAIEPPCVRCVAAREASAGAQLWCEQHRERHGRRHTYHQRDRIGSETNMPLVVRES